MFPSIPEDQSVNFENMQNENVPKKSRTTIQEDTPFVLNGHNKYDDVENDVDHDNETVSLQCPAFWKKHLLNIVPVDRSGTRRKI